MKFYFNAFLLISLFAFIGCTPTKETVNTPPSTPPSPVAEKPATVSMETPGTISFVAANHRYNAEGEFKKWHFTRVNMKGSELTTLTASLVIDIASVSEKSAKLADHLRAPDYFNVAQYAVAKMDISKVKSTGENNYTANMKLDMMGKTQDLIGEFTVVSTKPLTVSGTAKVDRSIFGVGSIDGDGVPNEIVVKFDTVIPR